MHFIRFDGFQGSEVTIEYRRDDVPKEGFNRFQLAAIIVSSIHRIWRLGWLAGWLAAGCWLKIFAGRLSGWTLKDFDFFFHGSGIIVL